MKKRKVLHSALAIAAIGVVAAVVGLWTWLQPPRVEPFEPTPEEAEQLALYQQPESWFLQRLQKPLVEIDGQRLDPKLQYMLEQQGNGEPAEWIMPALFATSRGRNFVRAQVDRNWLLFSGITAPMSKVEDRRIDGRGGSVHVRVYWPDAEPGESLPILVYAHGGGHMFGSVAALDRAVRLMANEARAIMVSVDYRRAPEHPYPAASDDAEDAFLWARAQAGALGGDPGRVAMGGDSAGGHVAINVAQRQLRKGQEPPAMLLLYYPEVGLPYGDRSFELFGKGYGLDAGFVEFLLARVFPDVQVGRDAMDEFMDPLHAGNLSGMPPTILSTSGFDILRDSGRAFAGRLQAEGVPVTYRNEPSLIHDYLHFTAVIEDAHRAATETAQLFGRSMRRMPARSANAWQQE